LKLFIKHPDKYVMLLLNLIGRSGARSRVSLSDAQIKPLDPRKLDPRGMQALQNLIHYRKLIMADGIFHSGDGADVKVRTNNRGGLMDDIDCLLIFVPALSASGWRQNILNRALSKIDRCEKGIKERIKPQIIRILDEVGRTFPAHASRKFDFHDPAYIREVSLAIRSYETMTVEYLEEIDSAIDEVLSIFGLTKNSKL
jgi:hypothetical protein